MDTIIYIFIYDLHVYKYRLCSLFNCFAFEFSTRPSSNRPSRLILFDQLEGHGKILIL